MDIALRDLENDAHCPVCQDLFQCDGVRDGDRLFSASAAASQKPPLRIPIQSGKCPHYICKPCLKSAHLALLVRFPRLPRRTTVPCPICRQPGAFDTRAAIVAIHMCKYLKSRPFIQDHVALAGRSIADAMQQMKQQLKQEINQEMVALMDQLEIEATAKIEGAKAETQARIDRLHEELEIVKQDKARETQDLRQHATVMVAKANIESAFKIRKVKKESQSRINTLEQKLLTAVNSKTNVEAELQTLQNSIDVLKEAGAGKRRESASSKVSTQDNECLKDFVYIQNET